MKPAVMLPTYNEAENLRKIIESILRAAPKSGLSRRASANSSRAAARFRAWIRALPKL